MFVKVVLAAEAGCVAQIPADSSQFVLPGVKQREGIRRRGFFPPDGSEREKRRLGGSLFGVAAQPVHVKCYCNRINPCTPNFPTAQVRVPFGWSPPLPSFSPSPPIITRYPSTRHFFTQSHTDCSGRKVSTGYHVLELFAKF